MQHKIVISDHALLRYIERFYNIALDPIRLEILAKVKPAIAIGAASLAIDDIAFTFKRDIGGVCNVTTTLRRNMSTVDAHRKTIKTQERNK